MGFIGHSSLMYHIPSAPWADAHSLESALRRLCIFFCLMQKMQSHGNRVSATVLREVSAKWSNKQPLLTIADLQAAKVSMVQSCAVMRHESSKETLS